MVLPSPLAINNMIPGFRASNGGVAGGERAEEPELAGAASAGSDNE
jgi:hypothetical protein